MYIDNKKILSTLTYAIKENLPTLIIGETGTGKTSAIRHLAEKHKAVFRRLNLNGSTSTDEFVGKYLVKNNSTYWVDGILTDAMRNGHWLLIDEINAGLPEVLFVLQSLLDDDGYIVLSDKEDKEIVRPHKEFRVFATMNPCENYTGTKELNKALMSRFPLVLTMDFLPAKQEQKVIVSKLKVKTPEETTQIFKMVAFANALRTAYRNGQLDFVMSTRELLFWGVMTRFAKSVTEGATLSFMSKANTDDRQVIKDLMKVHFRETTDPLLLELMSKGTITKILKDEGIHFLREKGETNESVNTHLAKGSNIKITLNKKTQDIEISVLEIDAENWREERSNLSGGYFMVKGDERIFAESEDNLQKLWKTLQTLQ